MGETSHSDYSVAQTWSCGSVPVTMLFVQQLLIDDELSSPLVVVVKMSGGFDRMKATLEIVQFAARKYERRQG